MRKIFSAALALACIWFASPALAALPSGYTELQYIESTGTQWIDTGYTPTTDLSKIEFKFNVSTDNTTIFGVSNSSESRVQMWHYQDRYSSRTFTNTTNNISSVVLSLNIDITGNLDVTNGKLTINGNSGISTDIDYKTNYSYPMYVFALNNAGATSTTIASGKVYYLKIYENNTLVRDFIPAKNASGKIGMYDTVNDVFYENKGTGEFIAGPDACNGTIVNYVSATGTGTQSGTPTPENPIEPTFYKQGNMVLRKVGDYADSYDATTGKITRRVGVKVFDGSEASWYEPNTNQRSVSKAYLGMVPSGPASIFVTHYPYGSSQTQDSVYVGSSYVNFIVGSQYTMEQWKQYLAQQYSAGTPVTIYYPLETETTEDWPASYCETPIKIATTKYNESAFSPLNTALANAISVVDTVVSNTITQAASIATLQTQKQTRPNDIADDSEKCPAGKKCLLVEDASGIPHWYEIVTGRLPDGYTELQYIESTGTQYIDTGIVGKSIVGIEYDFTILNDITVGSSLFGTRLYGNVGSGINFGHSADGKVTVDFFDGYRYTSNLSFEKNTPYRLVVQNNKYTLYNAITGAALDWHTFNATTSDLEYVAVLFGLNNGGSISAAKDSVKVTSCKIYTTNGIVDLVPAKNPDGKIGMYDLVGGRFYENAGDGSFIAGDPVAE